MSWRSRRYIQVTGAAWVNGRRIVRQRGGAGSCHGENGEWVRVFGVGEGDEEGRTEAYKADSRLHQTFFLAFK